jgi:glycosyltransferase involved in cell wall biosynthesis
MNPLISVVMPLFNAANTVSFALASLQAQTCDDWECIIVDDGSTDNSREAVHSVYDARIQYHSLDRNRGRGFARQYGLTICDGKYIAFLDADDWIYAHKFHQQINLLESEPDLALVSTGMAISNAADELLGVRNTDPDVAVIRARSRRIGMPLVAFAPSMIVADLAKATGFDPSFPIAEDVDFLLRALYGKPYAVLSELLYVYREHGSATPEKISCALDYCCAMFGKQFGKHPISSGFEIAKARGKQLVYKSAASVGLWDSMIQRRSRTPNPTDRLQYRRSWQAVSEIAAAHAVPM